MRVLPETSQVRIFGVYGISQAFDTFFLNFPTEPKAYFVSTSIKNTMKEFTYTVAITVRLNSITARPLSFIRSACIPTNMRKPNSIAPQ